MSVIIFPKRFLKRRKECISESKIKTYFFSISSCYFSLKKEKEIKVTQNDKHIFRFLLNYEFQGSVILKKNVFQNHRNTLSGSCPVVTQHTSNLQDDLKGKKWRIIYDVLCVRGRSGRRGGWGVSLHKNPGDRGGHHNPVQTLRVYFPSEYSGLRDGMSFVRDFCCGNIHDIIITVVLYLLNFVVLLLLWLLLSCISLIIIST